jgi:hypothetical protein
MQPNVRRKVRRRRSRSGPVTPWHWLALGTGTGLVLTAAVATAYRWLHWEEDEEADPRAEQVQELLKEAERLLAQGRGTAGE